MTLSEDLSTQNMHVTWSSFFNGEEVGRCVERGIHCQTDVATLNRGKKKLKKQQDQNQCTAVAGKIELGR